MRYRIVASERHPRWCEVQIRRFKRLWWYTPNPTWMPINFFNSVPAATRWAAQFVKGKQATVVILHGITYK
jgi:hypothetical protein